MEIAAERVYYETLDEVVPTGSFTFTRPPILHESLGDGLALGEPWSILVDVAQYRKVLHQAEGHNEAYAKEQARAAYLAGLAGLDTDEFEAEMFWETYLDVQWEIDNPYDLEADQVPTRRVRRADGSIATVAWTPDDEDEEVEEIEVDDEDGLDAVRRRQEQLRYEG